MLQSYNFLVNKDNMVIFFIIGGGKSNYGGGTAVHGTLRAGRK